MTGDLNTVNVIMRIAAAIHPCKPSANSGSGDLKTALGKYAGASENVTTQPIPDIFMVHG
jgi:hypothetical protein